MAFLVREALQTAGDLDEAIDVFKNAKRTCEYYYVLADGKTNRAVGMEGSWNKFQLVQPGEANPLLPKPVTDAVLLSAGSRYDELVNRTQDQHGKIDAEGAKNLMCRPVAMKSNLHNVLFAPKSTEFWVANAGKDGEPAADQKYHHFKLSDLLAAKPDDAAPEIPLVAQKYRS
jgi:hypothetical protein